MDPQTVSEKPDTKLIVETIVYHLDAGAKADWKLRCRHYVIALRLLQKHAADGETDAIDQSQRAEIAKHFEIARAVLGQLPTIGGMIEPSRLFAAVDFLVRTWSLPRPESPIGPIKGALLQAGVLVNMLELTLSLSAMAIFDRELSTQTAIDRGQVLQDLLDVSAATLDERGDA